MEVVIYLRGGGGNKDNKKLKVNFPFFFFFWSTVLRSFLTCLLSTPRACVCLMAGMGV